MRSDEPKRAFRVRQPWVMPDDDAPMLTKLANDIANLDKLICVLRESTPLSSASGRASAERLRDAEGQMQVLRMTISMDRPAEEIHAAIDALESTVKQLLVHASKSRTAPTTLAALQLATSLTLTIKQSFAALQKPLHE